MLDGTVATGEEGGSGYIVFSCGVKFRKHHYRKVVEGRECTVEEVYLLGKVL